MHGWNDTHASSDCFSLNKKKPNNGPNDSSSKSEPKKFSNVKFRKEINLLSKSSDRKKVLDQYYAAIKSERAKLQKASNKRKILLEGEDSSDSDESCGVIDMVEETPVATPKRKKSKKIRFCEKTDEEKTYLKQIQKSDESNSSSEEGEESD